MLEYDRIDISEGIDINKYVIYDMSLKAVSMQNLTIINHNANHYRVLISHLLVKKMRII